MILIHTELFRDLGLCLEMLEFSVCGYSKLGLYQSVDKLYLLLTGMPRYMHILEYNIRSLCKEFVYYLGNGFLISRDGM